MDATIKKRMFYKSQIALVMWLFVPLMQVNGDLESLWSSHRKNNLWVLSRIIVNRTLLRVMLPYVWALPM